MGSTSATVVIGAIREELKSVGQGLRRGDAMALLEARLDALRRKCTTGYGCGSSCISVQKECRARPSSAIGKERLKRLQQLAKGEIKPRGLGVPKPHEAQAMAAVLQGQRQQQQEVIKAERKRRQAAAGSLTAERGVELVAERKKAASAAAPSSTSTSTSTSSEAPPDTPRGVADRAAKELDPDYEFARPSAVGNVGEDLKNSARHIRNKWRSLSEAEADGTAAAMVTRDKLLKAEPLDLTEGLTGANYLTRLAGHLALKAFPARPYDEEKFTRYSQYGLTGSTTKTPAEMRKLYYDHLQVVKSIIDKRRDDADPEGMLWEIADATTSKIRAIRGGIHLSDHYNPLANSLVSLVKKVRGSAYSKSTVSGQMGTLAVRLRRANDGKSNSELADIMRNATEEILNGASIDKVTGTNRRRVTFNPADLYVGVAKRIGGRDLGVEDTPVGSVSVLADRMGMRGLQFGNSVTDDERAHHLRKTAEALVDLADITGLPDKAISLDGQLGLAFGARGKGRAAAHYEPGTKVINITRKNGVGTLAHEWGHALDDYIGARTPRGQQNRQRVGDGYLSEQTSDMYIPATGNKAQSQGDDPVWKAMDGVRKAIAATDYPMDLSAELTRLRIDRGPQRNYWLSGREVFARTFERYVQHKLESKGQKNTYLSGLGGESALWPNAEQIAQMAPAFDELMRVVRTTTFGGMKRRNDSREQRVGRMVATLVTGQRPLLDELERRVDALRIDARRSAA